MERFVPTRAGAIAFAPIGCSTIARDRRLAGMDWLKHSMLEDGYINPSDVESLVVTDDPNDCHGALDAVEHRRPRNHRRAA